MILIKLRNRNGKSLFNLLPLRIISWLADRRYRLSRIPIGIITDSFK